MNGLNTLRLDIWVSLKELNGFFLYYKPKLSLKCKSFNFLNMQATKSNYKLIKQKTRIFRLFCGSKSKANFIRSIAKKQARFLKKRNRNIIIKIDEDIELLDNFIWLTLGQIKQLMTYNNLVNMDTRTVISGIPYGNLDQDEIDSISFLKNNQIKSSTEYLFLKSTLCSSKSYHSQDSIISYVTKQKCRYDLQVNKTSLSKLDEW